MIRDFFFHDKNTVDDKYLIFFVYWIVGNPLISKSDIYWIKGN